MSFIRIGQVNLKLAPIQKEIRLKKFVNKIKTNIIIIKQKKYLQTIYYAQRYIWIDLKLILILFIH